MSTIDGGTVVIASRFAKLEISEPFFRFTFPTVTVEQGQAAELAIAVAKNKEFPGKAKVELLGLPAEVSSQPRELDAAAKEIVFPIQTSGKSPLGKHRALLCRAVVTVAGEPVTHLLGTGELRIQKPTPAKPAEAAKPKAAVAKTAAPVVKRLSRLEQLRQARAQAAAAPREEAMKAMRESDDRVATSLSVAKGVACREPRLRGGRGRATERDPRSRKRGGARYTRPTLRLIPPRLAAARDRHGWR